MAYSTITKPSLYFNTKLYTGSNSVRTETGVGFQPDWVWIKDRTQSGHNHNLIDAVRAAPNILMSDSTAGQITDSTDGLTAFTSDGFSLGANTTGTQSQELNKNGNTYVAWNWKANGAGSANTDGYISSTVSVNTTAGFSIVKYTGDTVSGRTIGHGLNAVPKMIMVKGTDSNSSPDNWCVYHVNLGNTRRTILNSSGNYSTGSGYWNDTSPTNQVFTIGNSSETNSSNGVYIAYCFAEKKGYSKIGGFTGNGNTDGPFIYTGFKPAFFLMKETSDSSTNWVMYDNKRNTGNAVDKVIYPNLSNNEGTGLDFDFLSNGIKCRNNNGGINGSGNNYIYLAFAEEPLVANVGGSIPATAR